MQPELDISTDANVGGRTHPYSPSSTCQQTLLSCNIQFEALYRLDLPTDALYAANRNGPLSLLFTVAEMKRLEQSLPLSTA